MTDRQRDIDTIRQALGSLIDERTVRLANWGDADAALAALDRIASTRTALPSPSSGPSCSYTEAERAETLEGGERQKPLVVDVVALEAEIRAFLIDVRALVADHWSGCVPERQAAIASAPYVDTQVFTEDLHPPHPPLGPRDPDWLAPLLGLYSTQASLTPPECSSCVAAEAERDVWRNEAEMRRRERTVLNKAIVAAERRAVEAERQRDDLVVAMEEIRDYAKAGWREGDPAYQFAIIARAALIAVRGDAA